MQNVVKMIRTAAWLAGIVVLGLAPGSAAQAQQSLDFSYAFSDDNVLSGVLIGTDTGDYFTVTGVQSLSFNSVNIISLVTGRELLSWDDLAGVGTGYYRNGSAVVTTDGSYMDFVSAGMTGNFLFANGDVYAADYGAYARVETVNRGPANDSDNFDAADWSASLAGNPVPEPGSLGLTAGAIGLVGVIARRRRIA